jgi:alkanesulfonate monooxygenase SsuD/methylene tetrahydromethanopterin reductase-like flavin-dependent oxidoreductase (luciferase family)
VIVGSPQEVKERLNEYKKNLDMNLLVVRPQVPGASESQRRDSFELLVGDVLPALN